MNILKSPKYSLPCIHCKENILFPDTEALKKHLLSEHESLVSSPKVTGIQEERYGFKSRANVPSSEVRINLNEQTTNHYPTHGSFCSNSPTRNISLSPQTSIYKSPVHSEVDFLADVSERKIKRLADALRKKDEQVQSLISENETLKADITSKDEQQERLRHRWRKEAEDVIRDLKTNYSDVLTQKQLLERQLNESELSKTKLRSDKDNLVKDYTDLQTKMAVEKRDLLQNNKTFRMNEKTQSEQLLSSMEVQKLKLEKDNLMVTVREKDEIVDRLQTSYKCLQDQLSKTEQMKDALGKECAILKGQLSDFETNQSASRHQSQNDSLTGLSSKLSRLETSNHELRKEIEARDQQITSLTREIENLKEDKQKLVANLENADLMLSKVSQHILPSSNASKSPSNVGSFTSNEMKTSLQQIMAAVKKISSRDAHSANQEVVSLKKELQRLNLLLVEEKATVKRLSADLSELEDVANEDTSELETSSVKLLTKFEALKTKHKKCVHNEKVRKQLRAERNIFKKKYFEVQKRYDLLNVLFDSTKEELQHRDDVMKDVQKEFKNMESGYIKALSTIDSLRQDIGKRDHELEKYKRESCHLLENLNKTSEEVDKLQNMNENLEARLDDLEILKSNVAEICTNIRELSENGQLASDSSVANIERLLENNRNLSNKVLDLQRKLHDEGQMSRSLQEKISDLEAEKSELLTEKTRLHDELTQKVTEGSCSSKDVVEYEVQIENLMLEKDILSSRVVILEGIREEMVILHSETDKLKRENQMMKKIIKSQEEHPYLSRSFSKNNSDDNLVFMKSMINDNVGDDDTEDFVKAVKTLDELGDEEKVQLNNMLSMPDFQRFLSTDNVAIDLHDSSDTSNVDHDDMTGGLSTERFENEHVVNHIFQVDSDDETIHETDPKEFVQRLHESKTDFPMESKQEKKMIRSLVGQVSRMSSDDIGKSLEKIFSESKVISSDIALQERQRTSSVDCNRVLQEFDKVIKEMSTPSLTKVKQVKFSDHMAGTENPLLSKSNSKQSDADFYKSFFQDALRKVYPQLATVDDDVTSKDPANDVQAIAQRSNNLNNNSKESGLTERVLKIMQSPPASFQQNDNLKSNITRQSMSPTFLCDDGKKLGDPSVLAGSFSDRMFATTPRRSSPGSAKSKTTTGSSQLFKNVVGVLPQISEQNISNEIPVMSLNTDSASKALVLLKSFIEKAEQIKGSPEKTDKDDNDADDDEQEDGHFSETIDNEHVADDYRSADGSSYGNNLQHFMLAIPASASTPNTPSTIHKPVSFDFSDNGISDLSLFKNDD